MNHQQYLSLALDYALKNIENLSGGPFGAIIVKDNEIIAIGVNLVTGTNDPTAHAEIVAIRHACARLKSFQLTDCTVYSSCEPCPMCFGALYWARPKAIYYAATRQEAAAIGFDDAFIYKQLQIPHEQQTIAMTKIVVPETLAPFIAWGVRGGKVEY